jgi:hypothetical protein
MPQLLLPLNIKRIIAPPTCQAISRVHRALRQ